MRPNMQSEPDYIKRAITRDTFVSVSVVAGIVTVALWLNNSLHAIDARLSRMEAGIVDRWTANDQRNWAYELKISNPNIIVPNVQGGDSKQQAR